MTTKKALIVVDVQNDFIDGSLAVADGEQAAQRIATLIGDVQGVGPHKVYDLVVTTQDWHINPGYASKAQGDAEVLAGVHWSDEPDFVNTWPVHCKADTSGAELSPRLEPVLDKIDRRFFKGHYSAAYSGFEGFDDDGETLVGFLRQAEVTDVDVVGIATDYCVKATALDAVKEGFTTRVLLPLTAAVAPESNEAARKEMAEAGVVLAAGGTVL